MDFTGLDAMTQLVLGLYAVKRYEDALTVGEAQLSIMRRLGIPAQHMLAAQINLANSYSSLGQDQHALSLRRDVHSGCVRFHGEEHYETLIAVCNYASSLVITNHLEEAKSLMRRKLPVARRVLGEDHHLTLWMRRDYGMVLYMDAGATLDDLREAVTTLEDTERTARRVFGGAHPTVRSIEVALRNGRADLRARETPSTR